MSYRQVFRNLKLKNKYVPKEHQPKIYFPNNFIRLHVPSVLERTNVVRFYIPLKMTKPELRSHLENYYNIDNIEEIHTTIKLGRKRRNRKTGRITKDADEKKAYVVLSDYVELDFTDEMKKEIMRHYDPSRNKEYWEQRRTMEAQKHFQQQQQQQQPGSGSLALESGSEKKE